MYWMSFIVSIYKIKRSSMDGLVRHFAQSNNVIDQLKWQSHWGSQSSSMIFKVLLMLIPMIYLFLMQFTLMKRNFRLFNYYRDDIDSYDKHQKLYYDQYYHNRLFYVILFYDIALLALGILAIAYNYWNKLAWIIYALGCVMGGFTHLIYSVCKSNYLLVAVIFNWLYLAANQLLYIKMQAGQHSKINISALSLGRNLQSFHVGVILLFAIHGLIQWIHSPQGMVSIRTVKTYYIVITFVVILALLLFNAFAYGPLIDSFGYIIGCGMTCHAYYQNSVYSASILDKSIDETETKNAY